MAKTVKTVKGICDICKGGPKQVPYIILDGSGRMCVTCYHRLGRNKCSLCGKVKLVLYKKPGENKKICSDCYRRIKGNYKGICPECGQEGAIHYTGPRTRICRKCRERFRALERIAKILLGEPKAAAGLDDLIDSKNCRIRVREVLQCISQLEVPRIKLGIWRFCGTSSGARLKTLCDEIGFKAGR